MEILHNPVVLFLFFVAGILIRHLFPLQKKLHKRINAFILNVSLPAIVLSKIPFLPLNGAVYIPLASAWILFFGCLPFAYLMKRIFKFSNQTFACIVLCCGLGNTSFVGYPVLTYLYGSESLKFAIFVDQPGSFLIMSTFGILMATYYSSGKLHILQIIKRLLTFPPFLIFIVSLFIPTKILSPSFLKILSFLGSWMVPLAMLSIGLQFKMDFKTIPIKAFATGIFYKLILGPFLIYVLLFFVLKKQGLMYTISVMECAMPPMITSSLIAGNFGLDEDLAAAFPTLGILFSVLTLSVWYIIL